MNAILWSITVVTLPYESVILLIQILNPLCERCLKRLFGIRILHTLQAQAEALTRKKEEDAGDVSAGRWFIRRARARMGQGIDESSIAG